MRYGMVVLVTVLALGFSGCAWSVGKKGVQASAGIASANATDEVQSEGFSEGGVDVVFEALRIAGRLAEAALRMPFSILQGAANGAAEPVQAALGAEE